MTDLNWFSVVFVYRIKWALEVNVDHMMGLDVSTSGTFTGPWWCITEDGIHLYLEELSCILGLDSLSQIHSLALRKTLYL